jgi:hypothetical protein
VGLDVFVVLLPHARLPLQEDIVERVTVARVIGHRVDEDIADPFIEYPS